MADNNYNANHKEELFFQRSNKLADANNAEKFRVERQYCDSLELVGAFVVDSGAGTLTFTPAAPTDAYDFRYLSLTVCDESGNRAANTGTGVVASVAVDVSGLDASDSKWVVTVDMSVQESPALDCLCPTFGNIEIPSPSSDPTVNVDTVAEGAQVIAVYQADGTTPIVDAGAAYALGSYPAAGGSEAQSIVIKNTGEAVLKISAIAIAPDVDGGALATAAYIYPGETLTHAFTIDTSGGAGAKTGSLTITSDDPKNVSYVVNVSFTLT